MSNIRIATQEEVDEMQARINEFAEGVKNTDPIPGMPTLQDAGAEMQAKLDVIRKHNNLK